MTATTTTFANYSQTQLIGANFDNLVIRANDLIVSGYFFYDSNGNIMPKLPYEITNKQVGLDSQNYLLAQYRGQYVASSGSVGAYVKPVSFTLGTPTGTSTYSVALDLTTSDLGGSDPNATSQTKTGTYGGFIVKSDGSAFASGDVAGNYKATGYSVFLPYNEYQGTQITFVINPYDFVWVRKPITTVAPTGDFNG